MHSSTKKDVYGHLVKGTDFKMIPNLFVFITPVERYDLKCSPTMLGASSHT